MRREEVAVAGWTESHLAVSLGEGSVQVSQDVREGWCEGLKGSKKSDRSHGSGSEQQAVTRRSRESFRWQDLSPVKRGKPVVQR